MDKGGVCTNADTTSVCINIRVVQLYSLKSMKNMSVD